MNIRQKCAAAIAVSLVISAALNIAVLRLSVFPSFIELENRNAVSDIQRALAAINSQILDTYKTVKDYSTWDDSYDFANGAMDTYVSVNLAAVAVENLKVNLISIHDRNGALVYDAAYEANAEDAAPVGPLALAVIDPAGALLATSEESVRYGLLMTERGPLLLASRPILRSSGDGPYAGTFVMGRYLDGRLVTDLNQAIDVRFQVLDAADRQGLDAAATTALAGLTAGDRTVIDDAGDGTLAVYALMHDLYDRPALLVRATVDRAVSQTGLRALLMAVGGIVAAGLLVMAVTVALLQHLLVGPISQLTQHLLAVGSSGDLSRRVALDRADEIGMLGRQFDGMLQKLAEFRGRLLEQSYSAGIAEMASGVLHNIRNQLAPLSMRLGRLEASLDQTGNSKLTRAIEELKSPTGDPERKQKILQFVELSCRRAGDRQAEMIDELKSVAQDFVRIENVLHDLDRFSRNHSSMAEVRLVEVVRETVAMLPKYPDIEVIIRIDPAVEGCPAVAAEPFVLKHVLQNLIVNAIESMISAGKTRGTIAIRGTAVSHDGKTCVDLQVQDEGIGIAAEKLETIFTRGFSTKKGARRGTGLHWCANSMLAIGGKILAESPGPQQGATMHVIIPAGATQAKEAA
jgi:sensor domain CHASE-containing protein